MQIFSTKVALQIFKVDFVDINNAVIFRDMYKLLVMKQSTNRPDILTYPGKTCLAIKLLFDARHPDEI